MDRLLVLLLAIAGLATACSGDRAGSSATFCRQSTEALAAASGPDDGPDVVEALQAVDVSGLDETERRSFDGTVSALASSVDAFTTGDSPNGWTTNNVATFIGRVCGGTVPGFSVTP